MATGMGSWSTTAASNNTADSNINWAEGQAPSTVNDSARYMMKVLADYIRAGGWFSPSEYTHAYVGATQFQTTSADSTSFYTVGRRVKAVGSSTGTIYGLITASSFSTHTTVTVKWDASGALSNETLTISANILDNTQAIAKLAGAMNNAKAVDVASATTTDIGAANGNVVHVTGTTTITSFGTAPQAGIWRLVIFDGALTLTHGASAIVLPGGANITTAANDMALCYADTTTKWIVHYQKASGAAVVGSGTVDNSVNGFRLTLTSGTPVTTSDVTGAGTLYLTPYKGNRIALYYSSAWTIYSNAEVSLSLTLTSGKPYDIWAYYTGSAVALEALVWTDATTRATALTYQDGVLVKNGDATRRYVGTIYASGANVTDDAANTRNVWNYYNRVPRHLRNTRESTDSWSYSTATIRQANANTANGFSVVRGLDEDLLHANVLVFCQNATTGQGADVGIGVDSTSAFATGFISARGAQQSGGNGVMTIAGSWVGLPGVGRHTINWLEYATGGTMTWFGDNGAEANCQSGIWGWCLA